VAKAEQQKTALLAEASAIIAPLVDAQLEATLMHADIA
jgi:hypothetical protein